MMDATTMRTAFTHFGCFLAAVRAIVDEQGIISIDELKILTDTEIENLCKEVRRPGGQVANPNMAKAGQQPQLPNHGKSISLWAELNIKLAAYYIRHCLNHVSRDCNAASITLAAIQVVRKLKEYEENYKAPDERPNIDNKDWPKTFESIDDYLAQINGEQNLPLAYIIRCNTAVPHNEDDPSTNYPMAIAKMIAQAPHGTAATPNAIYTANNAKLADELSEIVHDTVAWAYVKNHVRAFGMVMRHIMPCLIIILVPIMWTIRCHNQRKHLQC
jgi:hypothetical protein